MQGKSVKARALLLIGMVAVVLFSWPALGAAGPLQANFQTDPGLGEVPLDVHFSNTSSGGEEPLSYHWDFGDGGTSNDKSPTHVYQTPRVFQVKLTVTDKTGQTGFKSDNITVDGPTLVAALLPVSRSVVVGKPATAFVTVINAGHITAPAVGLKLDPTTGPGGAPLPAELMFQATDPSTNSVTGAPNALLDIAAGKSQSYLIAVTPTVPLPPTDVRFVIDGANTTRSARKVSGLNTLLLSASTEATPDIIAIAVTPDGNGILALPGTSGSSAFAVATANVGVGGPIRVSADTGAAGLPVGIVLCQTDPVSGQCTSSSASSVTTQIGPGATPTFAVFVTAAGAVPYDPELRRVFVRFTDAGGATRGATSVAVKTP